MKKTLRSRTVVRGVAAVVVLALTFTGCATTGGSTVLGTLAGATLGAVIGNQSGNAAEGALIGAALGGMAGYIIGDLKQERMRSRAEVEADMIQMGQPVPEEPVVRMETLDVAPDPVKAGQTVKMAGQYLAIGPSDEPPQGTMRLMYGDHKVTEKPLKFEETGQTSFSRDITLAEDAADGTYTVVVDVQRGNSHDMRTSEFQVVS